MKIKNLIKDQLRKTDIKGSQDSQLLKELLEYLADEKEKDINRMLLRDLVSKYALAEKRLRSLNEELIEKDQRINIDLKAAAEIQKSLLPQKTFFEENLEIAWKFEPCEHMGGDIFNIFKIDDEHLGVYMLDVSGHGVPAAMVTVSVSQFLQQNSVQLQKNSSIMPPAEVLDALDKEFPFERFNNFFTITYFIINVKNGDTVYSNAGHPFPIHLHKNESIELLKKGGPTIGLGDFDAIDDRKIRFKEGQLKLKPGDKLFIYTDGIVEYQNDKEELYGDDRFYNSLKTQKAESVTNMIDKCIYSLMEFGNNTNPQDHIT
ncbi:MAG: PP2C family protein-serine/threonine phosphatase, partial [Desulfobulbia bacterium]